MRNGTLSDMPTAGQYNPGGNPRQTLAIRTGYRDAAAGLPFRAEVDTWPMPLQGCYENGRLVWHNIKSSGLTPPDWPETRLERPASYCQAATLADAVVGPWRPVARARLRYEPETLGRLRPIPGVGRGTRWRPLPIPTTTEAQP